MTFFINGRLTLEVMKIARLLNFASASGPLEVFLMSPFREKNKANINNQEDVEPKINLSLWILIYHYLRRARNELLVGNF